MRKLHRWVALLVGLQVLVWLLSGLFMSWLDPEKVSGRKWSHGAAPNSTALGPTPGQAALLEPADLPPGQVSGAEQIVLQWLPDKAVYRVVREDGVILIDAADGRVISVDRNAAERIALEDFSGPSKVASIEAGVAPGRETRNHSGPYWRVNFLDSAATTYYVSERSGDILEIRNRFWRVFDFFWMLHIMDYAERSNFNNPLIITLSLVAIWLGLSGVLLLLGAFSRHDFDFLQPWRYRERVPITVVDTITGKTLRLRVKRHDNLFLALAARGVDLPSVCGGGGKCGKCRVRIESDSIPDPVPEELGLVPTPLLKKGYRLACRQQTGRPITVHASMRNRAALASKKSTV